MPLFHQLGPDEALQALASQPGGLSPAEAARRLAHHGLNQLQSAPPIRRWTLFVNQFKSFIIYILLVAALLAAATGEWVDAAIVLAILLANAGIGYWQELGAQKSLQALKRLDTSLAKVYRDGELANLAATELVPGDVIFVEAGDKVPADARLLTASRLKVEEAPLTGESVPVEKEVAALPGELPVADRRNLLFAATSIAEGSAKAVVVATGMATEIGQVAALLHGGETELTPLQLRLEVFGRRLGYGVLAICGGLIGIFAGQQLAQGGFAWPAFFQLCLVAVSLAVAAVPEGLPAVVTVALSIGIKKLLAKKALVKKLASVETLGSCDVICSDKTGTLTQNQMTVTDAWWPGGQAELRGTGYDPSGQVVGQVPPWLFQIGALCNNASLYLKEGEWQAAGDPMEAALLVSARKANAVNDFERLAELPFDSVRKCMSVAVGNAQETLLLTKGAPNLLLDKCDRWLLDGQTAPLTEADRATALAQVNRYAAQAKRVLAFAYRPLPAQPASLGPADEQGLILAGLQALTDPPRPEVAEAVQRAQAAGIRLIMITGDHLETAQAVGEQIGIRGQALGGAALDALTDDELAAALAQGTHIFARATPLHKMRIIAALKSQQHVVAMTGDGVNDAPALQRADIGVAVGSGTDVAKEAADFVLLDNSFAHIVNAIEEGRGIYDNIQKAIMHLLSGNLSEVIIVVAAVLLGWPLPLTAIMLLWINLITDGMPALALALDPHSPEVMRRRPLPLRTGILPRQLLLLLGLLGLLVGGFSLGLFARYGGPGASGEAVLLPRTVVFQFIALAEMVILFTIRAYFRTPFLSNGWVWAAVGFTLALQALLMYTPLANLFGLVALGPGELGALGLAGLVFALLAWAGMAVGRAQAHGK
jgi:P-type Ca2+ transporter type 2C